MSENNQAPSEEPKSSEKKIFLFIILLFLALVAGFLLMPEGEPVDVADTLEAQTAVEDTELNEDLDADSDALSDGQDAVDATSAETAAVSFDMALAKTERILGDRSAPIKITEHSSFSCGHCGKFHRDTYQAFKAAYIDTGKAYLVFSDFPLNAPALHASMAGRCLPEQDRYFDFVEEVFADQNQWAYDATKYIPYLKAKSAEYGLNDEAFNACIQNEELQEALLKRINAIQQRYDIRSTPSFVINNQKVITGGMTFENFDAAIQNALAEIEAEAAGGADAP